ncbi:HNH endonuclease [Cryobacterium zongtaii]|uniref:HNH endonuclease n=1 Tax=Cryobacterium zongtaii TaxID=1259217 RepID=A0A2S3Z9E6_9MICO|nr:HNH endonuclease [Cryobacterium zongtaii]POH62203.1 HNH endonuclease [Cryobacterium zongtaii]
MAGKSAGRSGSRWRTLCKNQKAKGLVCWLCGQPIDYKLKSPHVDSFTVDHVKSWKHHPELREDPANLASAHRRCNSSKGAGAAKPGLGNLSEEW